MPKMDEVTGKWRKRLNEELNDLYSALNTIRVIKSRRMRWAVHAARMRERRGTWRILVGEPEGKSALGRHRCRWEDEKIRQAFRKCYRGAWTVLIWLRKGIGGGLL